MKLDKNKLLTESQTFCMLPWTHLHTWPNGNTYPCCISDSTAPVGHLSKEHSLQEIWNSPKMKELRLKMLKGEKLKACERCYELEAVGLKTLRHGSNEKFAHHWPVVESTQKDGTVKDMNIIYFDFRASNLCNFRCRTCGPELSSAWRNDAKALGSSVSSHVVDTPFKTSAEFFAQIEDLLPKVERIYFAGGEPLLSEEHWQIIKSLHQAKRFDVEITYNTNFSNLSYKGENIYDYWRDFRRVSIGASLDATGKKAEYLRKGTQWAKIIENRKKILKENPRAEFHVNFTLSAFNIFEAPAFHREWVESGLLHIWDWNFNPVTNPNYFRVNAIPLEIRKKAVELYQNHYQWIKQRLNTPHEMIDRRWNAAIEWLNGDFEPQLLKEFISNVTALDQLRNEKLFDVFPELKEIYLYV